MAVLNNTGIRMGASGAGGDAYQIEKSLRFNKDDDAKLSRTFTSAGDQTKFTVSFWFKNCDAGANNYKMFFCVDNSGASNFSLYGGYLGTTFYDAAGSGWAVTANTSATHLFRDPSAWYHIVLSIDTAAGTTNADRQKIWVNSEQLTLTFTTYWDGLMTGNVRGWNTADEHFIGMRGSSYGGNWLAAEYHFIDGQALTPSDFGETNEATGQWVPIEYTGGSYGTNGFYLKFNGTDLGEDSSGNDNHWTANNLSTLVGNGNHASEVSGTPYNVNYPITNMFNGLTNMYIAYSSGTTTWTPDGGLSFTKLRVYLYQSSGTGEITFNWSGGSYTASFTNAIADYDWIDVTSNVTSPVTSISWAPSGIVGPYIGKWEVDDVELIDNSFSVGCDVSTDTPTPFDDEGNGTGNYATWNPLQNGVPASPGVFSQGNLQFYGNVWDITHATIGGLTSGKWYHEFTLSGAPYNQASGSLYNVWGWTSNPNSTSNQSSTDWLGFEDTGWYRNFGSQTDSSTTLVAGDVLSFAVDLDANTFNIRKNNSSVLSGTIGGTVGRPLWPFHMSYNESQSLAIVNFGQRPFAYTPPSGYLALNTYNLDDTEITSGEYEGNGDADGPFVWMNATPATLKIDTTDPATTTVAFDPDDVDPLAGGFKIRNSSTNNGSGTTYYWLATTDNAVESAFKYANAQSNE